MVMESRSYTVQEGAANRSYGIQVAALAGVPRSVLSLAKAKLHELETRDHSIDKESLQAAPSITAIENTLRDSKLYQTLEQLDPDSLSPRDALDWLYKIKELARTEIL